MVFGSVPCDRCRSVIDVELVTFDRTRILCQNCVKLGVHTTCRECKLYTIPTKICSVDGKEHNMYEACTVTEESEVIEDEAEEED